MHLSDFVKYLFHSMSFKINCRHHDSLRQCLKSLQVKQNPQDISDVSFENALEWFI